MLRRLIDHLIWADRRTAESFAVLASPDPELQKIYAHLFAAEAVWLARVTGNEDGGGPWPTLDFAECRALMASNHAEFASIALVLDATELTRSITYTNTKGDTFTNTVEEILHHAVMHGMYHRGQIARAVRQAGGTPLSTDFILFLRGPGS